MYNSFSLCTKEVSPMYDLQAIQAHLQNTASPLFAAQQEAVRCFYKKLTDLQDWGDPLFAMWRRELTFTYGDLGALLSQNARVKPRELWALYGFSQPEEPDLLRLLQSIQTFYSVLIKLIAFNMVSRAMDPRPAPAEAYTDLENILSGRAFRRLGICNYCYDDWFSWLLKYWDDDTGHSCRRLREQLAKYDTILSVKGFLRSFRSDTLKTIYETVIPKSIRHALGEYYTPDWLAACTIQNALQASSRSAAETRFIDPTCGAGTFLTQAMRMIQADSPDGLLRPGQAAGFDINALAVLTAKANYLGTMLDQLSPGSRLCIPLYHYDVINTPAIEEGRLLVDTNCDLVCRIPLAVCERLLSSGDPFSAEALLELVEQEADCRALREQLAALDGTNARVIANILLNRIFAYYEAKADIVVGNPPWVNWEYLPSEYKSKSQHLWPAYGLFSARGPELSFSKEDISILITYAAIDRFVADAGYLSFVLRQAIFQSAQNGAGFRRFHLKNAGVDFRVLQVDDLRTINPFEGVVNRCALVLIRKNEAHAFPVPYRCWRRKAGFVRAVHQRDAAWESVRPFIDMEEMVAFPAGRQDPTSVWIHAPADLATAMDTFLGTNPYKARTGVFTGGANAVYWMGIGGQTPDGLLRVHNLVDRGKRRVSAIQAELEPTFVYPLVQGSDLSLWSVDAKAYILCPHTWESKMRPVDEAAMQAEAPRTYDYLCAFRDDLDARKGFAGWEREMQDQCFYAILRIGSYTFAPYKVAWRYIAQSFITAVITSAQDPFLGEKLCLPNEKVMYVGTDCREEAYYLCGILSSSPVSYCVKCYMNPTSISAHVLDKLRIAPYDPAQQLHRTIAAICEAGHQTGSAAEKTALRQALDQAVGELYGVSPASLERIQKALASA